MEEPDALRESLRQVDTSLFFLLLVIFSVLLSFWATRIQREQLRLALAGGDVEGCPSVFPLRCGAAALVIGALGFFFALTLDRLGQAGEGGDPASLRANALASALTLAAALIRFDDLRREESRKD